MKLSIIIPCYNAEPYIKELLDCLDKQITDEVEVLLIDDGSKEPIHPKYQLDYKWLRIFRQKNKGVASARNRGLQEAKGDIIAFIDADDLVSSDYVKTILETDGDWDYLDLSWRSLEDLRFNFLLRNRDDRLSNPSACTRAFKRDYIGDTRFNEKKDAAEDEDFTRRLNLDKGKHIAITHYMYYYRITTPDSFSKRYRQGRSRTKRIVYYLPLITDNDVALLEEVKRETEENEVVILTNRNELPELERYANVVRPIHTWADEARGVENGKPNKYTYIRERSKPMKTQVVIYTDNTYKIGGIESFIYNFCKNMSKHYDIMVVYGHADPSQIARLLPMVPVVHLDPNKMIECDTLIVNRIFDKIPSNIHYKKAVQMVHGCKDANPWHIPSDKGQIICVSEAVKNSFGEETKNATVIKNLVSSNTVKEPLLLVSATRLDTNEKGQDRMLTLARNMERQGVAFIWLYFANTQLRNAPKNMIKMEPTLDIEKYIKKADYLVQLSDTEAFCYSIVESLLQGTPVITTPLPVLSELGVKDKENAHVVPFNLEDYDTTQLYDIPEFKYTYNNGLIVSKWKKLLGNTKPTGNYKPEAMVTVKCIKSYRDVQLDRTIKPGEENLMQKDRALAVQEAGFGIIKEG